MRYTPGRAGRESTKDLESNGAAADGTAAPAAVGAAEAARAAPAPAPAPGAPDRGFEGMFMDPRTGSLTADRLQGARRARVRKLDRPTDDRLEHLRRQAAGLGVVAAAMIRVEQHPIGAEGVLGRVREPVCSGGEAAGAQHGRVCEPARARESPAPAGSQRVPPSGNRCRSLISSGSGLFAGGRHLTALVMRTLRERKPIVAPTELRRARQTELEQRPVQQNAGVIAGEGPSGAVGAVHAGRETDDQQARRRIAERRHRPAEIIRLLAVHLTRNAASRGQRRQSGSKALLMPAARVKRPHKKTGYADTRVARRRSRLALD